MPPAYLLPYGPHSALAWNNLWGSNFLPQTFKKCKFKQQINQINNYCKINNYLLGFHEGGSLCLFHFIFVIGGQLLYNVMSVSAVQHPESAVSVRLSPLSWASLSLPIHPSWSWQSTEWSSPCHVAASRELSVLPVVTCVCQCFSLNIVLDYAEVCAS